MSNRLTKLGIKQVIRLEWMEFTLSLLLAGLGEDEIRNELDAYLEDKKQSGGIGDRGDKTYTMALYILMKTWVSPVDELISLRNACLNYAREKTKNHFVLHWIMLSTAYPFWHNVTRVLGNLFTYQDIVAKKQVIKRLKEIYGDRQTVSRNARYVITSMIAWEIIDYSDRTGYYIQKEPISIIDDYLISLLYEGILLNTSDFRSSYQNITDSKAHFPFLFSKPTMERITRVNPRISVLANGYSGTLLTLDINRHELFY
jgi:hypothetical protein